MIVRVAAWRGPTYNTGHGTSSGGQIPGVDAEDLGLIVFTLVCKQRQDAPKSANHFIWSFTQVCQPGKISNDIASSPEHFRKTSLFSSQLRPSISRIFDGFCHL